MKKSVAKLYSVISSGSASLEEAQRLQGVIARADYTLSQTGVAGAKALLGRIKGYGGKPRKPLLPFNEEGVESLLGHPDVQGVIEVEGLKGAE